MLMLRIRKHINKDQNIRVCKKVCQLADVMYGYENLVHFYRDLLSYAGHTSFV